MPKVPSGWSDWDPLMIHSGTEMNSPMFPSRMAPSAFPCQPGGILLYTASPAFKRSSPGILMRLHISRWNRALKVNCRNDVVWRGRRGSLWVMASPLSRGFLLSILLSLLRFYSVNEIFSLSQSFNPNHCTFRHNSRTAFSFSSFYLITFSPNLITISANCFFNGFSKEKSSIVCHCAQFAT
jgi:hypothetical protein